MKEHIVQINAICGVSLDDVKRIPKNEIKYLVNRQLFRDAAAVMLKEIDSIPIQIIKTIEATSTDDIYKLNFLIIAPETLEELKTKKEAYDKLMTPYKPELIKMSAFPGAMFSCKCNKVVFVTDSHCSGCGQKLWE